MTALVGIGGEERYWVHVPARKPRAYKTGGLVAAARAVKGSPMANDLGDSELIHVNKYELEQLREMWGDPVINPETGLPAYGLFKVFKKIVKGVAKIAATAVLTPVLGPVGAAMAVNAASTAISGGNLGDIAKSAAFTGITAGAGQLGAKFAPGLGISEEAGRAIGAGLGGAGVAAAQGANLEQALMGGVQTGIGTYATNKALSKAISNNTLGIGSAYRGLTDIGYDISGATGIRLGGPNYGKTTGAYGDGEEIIVTAPKGTSLTYTGSTDISPVTSATPSDQSFDYGRTGGTAQQVTDGAGNIIVTALPTTNLTLGPGTMDFSTKGIGGAEPVDVTEDEDGTIYVNGRPITDFTIGAGTTVGNQKPVTDDDEIVVTAPTGGPTLVVPTGTTPPSKETVTPTKPGGTITPLYPKPVITESTTVPDLVPTGGTYTYTPLNRGLANISFDPFTYGQAIGGQPGEFLFFTEGGRPYGDVGKYTGPAMADGGEVDGDDMMSHLIAYRKNGGHEGPGRVKGVGSGQEDKIPAWLSDGEYVWSAQDVADLGDGSTDEGVRRLDKMREMVRRQAGRKDVKKIAKPQQGIDKMLKAVGGAV